MRRRRRCPRIRPGRPGPEEERHGRHAVDKKVVGPAYKDVAAKYAGQKDAVDKLAVKVVKGGSGVWGAVPMPANPQVTDAEAKQLVAWIMTLK